MHPISQLVTKPLPFLTLFSICSKVCLLQGFFQGVKALFGAWLRVPWHYCDIGNKVAIFSKLMLPKKDQFVFHVQSKEPGEG